MNDDAIQSQSGDSSKNQIRQQLTETEIHLASTDIEVDVSNAIRLPFDQIPALGVAFGSLPTMFRSISTTINIPTLFQVTDKLGKPLDPSVLQAFNDGTGLLGSFRDAATGFGQARLHPVGSIQSVSTIPYDPTTLFMAVALAQINQKLDSIQNTIDEMFEYLRLKDKAALRGNIKTLEDTLEDYRNNWNNSIWRNNAHMKVADIKQESNKAIIHLRGEITSKLQNKGPVEIRLTVGDRLNKVLDMLKEYQLAVYTYSFASFLDPMLCENFDEANLCSIRAKINERETQYQELYADCHNAIEAAAKGSIDSIALGGVSAALSGLGSLIKQTPLGDHTPIDEALEGAGNGVGGFNDEQTRNLIGKLEQAKTPDVGPFKKSLESINALHNHPQQIAIDRENIYLLPALEEDC